MSMGSSMKQDLSVMKGLSIGTIFGPKKLLTGPRKRFRSMSGKEFEKYLDKAEKSEGFDVDDCPGTLPGRIVPVSPDSIDWEPAEDAAKFACEGNSIVYKQLLKANLQPVGGNMHYVTFTAVDERDNVEKVFRAKVWEKPIKGVELIFCKEFIRDEQTAVAMRKEIAALLEQMAPFPKPPPRLCEEIRDGNDEEIEATEQEINGFAYWCLVKDLRSLNPTWKIAKAKKVASKKWKSFSRSDKNPYIMQAEIKFRDKCVKAWFEELKRKSKVQVD